MSSSSPRWASGTVAAGWRRRKSDVVLISGHDGGTGAAPLTSIKHAGIPWELGLAETQQTLVRNGLRDRIVVQVDGQLKTGRDVVIAALLGAEEFGFATAPLVVSGCVMMRVCHLDTCPVGIATQNPELRERFTGKPEFVEHFFEFIATGGARVPRRARASHARSKTRSAGSICSTPADAVEHWKATGLDLSAVLAQPAEGPSTDRTLVHEPRITAWRRLSTTSSSKLVQAGDRAGERVSIELAISNVDRTVGTLLGYEITSRYGAAGLADGTITLTFTGSAGQSFGAFVPRASRCDSTAMRTTISPRVCREAG